MSYLKSLNNSYVSFLADIMVLLYWPNPRPRQPVPLTSVVTFSNLGYDLGKTDTDTMATVPNGSWIETNGNKILKFIVILVLVSASGLVQCV